MHSTGKFVPLYKEIVFLLSTINAKQYKSTYKTVNIHSKENVMDVKYKLCRNITQIRAELQINYIHICAN